jgi:hypothetical protein
MKTRTAKLPKTDAEIAALAARILPGSPMRHLISEGYSLGAGSRCWPSKRGITARLVYRHRDIGAAGFETITLIFKGVTA